MSEKYIGALDQGTTSTRFLLFNAAGVPAGFDQVEHQQITPQPGWVEHDPEEILAKTLQVIAGAYAMSGISASQVVAMGITNQRETTVVWDKTTGKPVYNAIVWQDMRTDAFCRDIDRRHGPAIREKTGLPVQPYFSASKIRWILDHVPGVRERAEKGALLFGTIDTWLIWKLSGGPNGGVHVTDATNASRTLLLDLKTLQWDPWLLEVFGIPAQLLPQVKSSSEVYAEATLLPHPLPIASAIGDQQAALFGQACFEKGETKNTYGTGCFLLMNTGSEMVRSQNGLLTTVCALLPGEAPQYGLEGSVAMAGATVQWLRDNLGIIGESAEVETLAASVTDNGGVYFVPAFSGLFAPYWRPDARGAVVGLTRFATKAHIARSALEAVAYQTRDVLEAMERDFGGKIPALKVDGGMTANNLLLQFQADILGERVIRPVVAETTALGAAYAAGLATWFWKNKAELRTQWAIDRRWEPRIEASTRAALYSGWKKAVEKSLGWVDPPEESS